MIHDRFLPPDHQAISALQTPHAPAGSAIDVVNPLAFQLATTTDIVVVVGVASVDYDIAWLEHGPERIQDRVDGCRWNHQPHRPRFAELLREVGDAGGGLCALCNQLLHSLRMPGVHHAIMARFQKPLHHIRTHSSQTDHSELHLSSSLEAMVE